MSKIIQGFLILLLLFAISGCGGGATSGDPLGTDSIKVEASATSVSAGQSSLITATVTNVAGKPVIGRSVSFSLLRNNSSGTLSILNNETTGNGQAMASYAAGVNLPASSVQDTIQAGISNGSAAAVVITRTAGTVPTANITLTADPASLIVSRGGNASLAITATVRDSSGAVMIGVPVTFTPFNVAGGINVIAPVAPAPLNTGSDGKAIQVFSITNAETGALIFTVTGAGASAVISVAVTGST